MNPTDDLAASKRRTGAAGRFVLTGLSGGTHEIEARLVVSDEWSRTVSLPVTIAPARFTVAPGERAPLDLVVDRPTGVTVEGNVRLGAGDPSATEIGVLLDSADGSGRHFEWRGRPGTSLFRIPYVDPGEYDVEINVSTQIEGGFKAISRPAAPSRVTVPARGILRVDLTLDDSGR